MKKISSLILLLFCIVFISCQEEGDEPLQKEKVQFAFNVAPTGSSDGRINVALPEGSFLKIKLTPKNSTTPETFDVPLYQMGDGVISEPLELVKGRYFIQDFLIMSGSEVLYATPKRGSPLAQAVIHPLPFSFVVTRDQISNIAMEVVNTEGVQPEQFGYASFGVEVVHPLPLVVFGFENEQWKMLNGTAYIMDGDSVMQTFNLAAKVNTLGFTLDPAKTYVLRIVVADYPEYTTEFDYNTVLANLNGSPWKIYRGNEFLFRVSSDGGLFDYVIEGQGTLIGDLGNGRVETLSLPARVEIQTYGFHTFRFLGDLEGITALYPGQSIQHEDGSYHGGYDVYYVNVRRFRGEEFLTSLKRFDLPFGSNLDQLLDFRNAHSLERIYLYMVDLTQGLKLPATSNLNYVWIDYKNEVTREEVDEIVTAVHSNAVSKNILNGVFYLVHPWEEYEVPISPESTAKVRSLNVDYNWQTTF